MKKLIPFAVLALFSTIVQATGVIKKSNSGICHDITSSYYERTKKFIPYDSMDDCLASGGRLIKGTPPTATKSPIASDNTYSRDAFGRGWDDEDGDCLNTRHEILLSQSTSTAERSANRCSIVRGRWNDPYTGKIYYKATDLDIDHIVPLKWAWEHGANRWIAEKREKFANDPVNLIAVDKSANRSKGAQGPLEWLPPNNAYHCQYVTRFVRIKQQYGLTLSGKEQKEMDRLRAKLCK